VLELDQGELVYDSATAENGEGHPRLEAR